MLLSSNSIIIPSNNSPHIKFNPSPAHSSLGILAAASPTGSNNSSTSGEFSPNSSPSAPNQPMLIIVNEKAPRMELVAEESASSTSGANFEDELDEGDALNPSSRPHSNSAERRKISSSNCSTISSSTTNTPRLNHSEKRRWEKPEVCLICSQPAQCLNFGAHCCHACRMFFRRSVLKFKEFHCKFEGNCDTTKGKNCRSCRFDACVLAQLDISLIQFPPDFNVPELKRRLEEKRAELRQKRERSQSTMSQTNAPASLSPPKSANAINAVNEIEKSFSTIFELIEFNKCLDHLLLAEKQAMQLRYSPNNLMLEYLCGKGLADLFASQMNVLNFVELFTANGSPLKNDEHSMMEANGIPFIGSYLNLDMLLQIELMRTLPMFEDIGIEDKIRLFQQNIHKLVTLSNGFYSFQQNADTVVYPNQIRPFNLCRRTLERNLSGEKLARYMNLRRRAFCDVMAEFKAINLSVEEFVLLRAVIFCNTVPDQCSQETKMRLKTEAERYGRCLLRHLQMKNGEGNGARKYAECLLFATKIFDCNRRQNKFYELIEREAFGQNAYCAHPPFVLECLWWETMEEGQIEVKMMEEGSPKPMYF